MQHKIKIIFLLKKLILPLTKQLTLNEHKNVMKAKRKQSEKVLPEPGAHIAILTQILDWGTVTDVNGDRRKVEFIFELPEDLHVFDEARGEEPLIITRKFGNTLGRGSKMAEALIGLLGPLEPLLDDDKELDLELALGKICQVNLAVKADGDYENVEILGYIPLPKNDKRKFKPHGELKVLDLDNFDVEVFKSLPDWKQKEIAKSPEYKEVVANAAPERPAARPQASRPAPVPAKSNVKASELFKGKKKK